MNQLLVDFAEVVIVDVFRCLDERQQASWKHLLQASPSDFVETTSTKIASAFFPQLEEKGKVVKLPTDCELKHATGMMSPDEWIHHGLEFAWKVWECRSEDRGGKGTGGGESQDIADELRCLGLAIECFSKAGPSGKCLVLLLVIQNLSQYTY